MGKVAAHKIGLLMRSVMNCLLPLRQSVMTRAVAIDFLATKVTEPNLAATRKYSVTVEDTWITK